MRCLLLAVVLTLTTAASAADKDVTAFGGPVTIARITPLAEALTKPDSFAGREIAVEGVVTKACRAKGCWLVLADGASEVRVTFKDYGFFVPKTLAGRRVRVQGVVARRTLSVKEARHYLQDEGASKDVVGKVTAPVEAVSFVATGVALAPGL